MRPRRVVGGVICVVTWVGVLGAVGVTPVQARTPSQPQSRSQKAVPFYTAPQWMQRLNQFAYEPRAQAFERASLRLNDALAPSCDAHRRVKARAVWAETVTAWEALSAVSVGPLIERRSSRRIDFQPTRVPMLERVMMAPPADVQGLASVGAPAKGLPALEWLLWQGFDADQPFTATAATACTYARLLAAEVLDEAQALRSDFAQRTAASLAAGDGDADEAAVVAQAAEFVNQWVGGLEALRWHHLGKPLARARGAAGVQGRQPHFARHLSAHTAQTWATHWATLRDLARSPVAVDGVAPGMVSLSLYLKGRGLLDLSQRLDAAVDRADRDMARARVAQPASLQPALQSLGALRHLVETEVASALKVNIGFSDADGD